MAEKIIFDSIQGKEETDDLFVKSPSSKTKRIKFLKAETEN